jgi:tetratricopeptide (TPR) repeat protein
MGRIPATLRPIFRDRDDFTAGHTLGELTLAALESSNALIVICSPAAAKSHYVNEEIRLFKSGHSERAVIPLIVDGKPGHRDAECFPTALKFKIDAKGRITKKPVELLAADVRDECDGKHLALAKVVAGLLGVSSDDIFRRAERERRRKSRAQSLIAAVIAGLVLTGGFLAWQSHQRQQTIAEVEALVTKYSVASLKGTANRESLTEAITAIAEGAAGDARYAQALGLLKAGKPEEAEPLLKLVAQDKEKRALRESKEAAAAYRTLGIIIRLSDPKRAREAFTKAAELDPDDAIAAFYSAHAQFLAGNLDKSQQAYNHVLALEQDRDDTGYPLHWWSLHGLGEIAELRGDLGLALELFRKAHSEAEKRNRADPQSSEWQFAVAQANESVGDISRARGDLAEALESYRDCVAIVERLAKDNPIHIRSQRSLSAALVNVGDVLMEQGNSAEALGIFRHSAAIMDRIVNANPDAAKEHDYLSVSLSRVGAAYFAQGELGEALKYLRDSLAIIERLVKVDPGNAEWQLHLAARHGQLAEVLAQQGDVALALKEYRLGREIIAQLMGRSSENAQLPKELADIDTQIMKLESAVVADPEDAQRD